MFRQYSPHLFVRGKITPRNFLVGGREIGFFFRSELNDWQVSIKQYHASKFVLLVGCKASNSLNGFIKKLSHVDLEEVSSDLGRQRSSAHENRRCLARTAANVIIRNVPEHVTSAAPGLNLLSGQC